MAFYHLHNRLQTTSTSIARLCYIGHSFLKFSPILLNSERKICDKVMLLYEYLTTYKLNLKSEQ